MFPGDNEEEDASKPGATSQDSDSILEKQATDQENIERMSSLSSLNGAGKTICIGEYSATEEEIDQALSVLDRSNSISRQAIRLLRRAYFQYVNFQSYNGGRTASDSAYSPIHSAAGAGDDPRNAKRLRMTKQQALEIYDQRPNAGVDDKLRRGCMAHCKELAVKYGVTPKTIRDIW